MSETNFNLPLEDLVDTPLPPGKECRQCNRYLPYEEFWLRELAADGYQTYCKTCQSAKVKASQEKARGRESASNRHAGECVLCHTDINRKMKSELILGDKLICGYCFTFLWQPFCHNKEAYMALLNLVASHAK